jgi:hypothetical protein
VIPVSWICLMASFWMTVKSSNCLSKAGQQQDGVFQFAFAAVQRALAEIAGHDRGADRDGRNQEYAAKDKPVDRIGAGGMSDAQRCGTVCRHWSRSLPRLQRQKQISYAPAQHMRTLTVWK